MLYSEGDQMLQVFSCQATVEHGAQWLGSAVLYCVTVIDTQFNLTSFQGEQTSLCLTGCYQYVEAVKSAEPLLWAQGHPY